MKRLSLHYQQPDVLAADLSNPTLVWVGADDELSVGASVLLDITAPELKAPASVIAKVVSKGKNGYHVSLDSAALAPMRLLLSRNDAAKPFGRRAPRVDCQLPAKVLSPLLVNGCSVTNLSATGMTLVCRQNFDTGTLVSVSVLLSGLMELLVHATVMSVRHESQLLALDFVNLDAETKQRIEQMTSALLGTGPSSLESPTEKRVLIADDDASITSMLARVVLDAGHIPLTVSRGDEALAVMHKERPHLAFLDVLMPGLDGVALCLQIRAEPQLNATPLILVSALDESRLAQSLTASTANEALSKPLKLSVVRGVLAKYLLYSTSDSRKR